MRKSRKELSDTIEEDLYLSTDSSEIESVAVRRFIEHQVKRMSNKFTEKNLLTSEGKILTAEEEAVGFGGAPGPWIERCEDCVSTR